MISLHIACVISASALCSQHQVPAGERLGTPPERQKSCVSKKVHICPVRGFPPLTSGTLLWQCEKTGSAKA